MFLVSAISYGQTGTIRGNIYDNNSGEPIIYGTVILENTDIGTTTDINGFFTFTNVPIGEYNIVATYIGFDQLSQPVIVKKNSISYEKLYLLEGGVNLGVVDISASREKARSEVQISELTVSQKDIKLLPSTGGDADIVQYLQVLPGVISTGDQGGQLYIRGGSPVQNKILLDGLTIYNPFHSIGFYSIFETELIKNVDVLTGGFGAEHGGRISAIIDITTREGNKKNLSGQLSASPFMVKALVEGPIIKLKENGGAASFVLTTKRSIIDETSQSLYDYASVNDSLGLPFQFQDTYGKLSFVTENGSRFNLFGFNFTDRYNNPSIADIDWKNTGGGLDFTLLPTGSSMVMNGLIGFTSYETALQEADEDPRTSKIREYNLGLDFTFFGNNNEVKYGLDVKSIRTEFNFTNPFDLVLTQFQNTTEISGFLKYKQILGNLIIEPSIRLQYYASLSELSLEPRLGFKYNVTDALRIKGAGGVYTQNLISTSNERDVVNLFTGFLSGPEEAITSHNGGFTESKLQKSQHAILGFEYDVSRALQINVEGYYKNFPQLVIVNRNKISAEDTDYSSEEGEAYGVDFSVKYNIPRWYLWATYSHGYVNRFDGEQTYPTVFDRRHNVNALLSYDLKESGDWKVSLRWNMGSGFPFTKTQGFYNFLPFLEGVGTDYLTDNPDNIGILFSEDRNSGRLPYYHRLDLSTTYIHRLSKRANIEVVASVTNAYDRENIFFFDRLRYERVNQLPIIPSASIKLNF
jgi:hypothetical protein